jgi:hypothetical protein
LPLQHADDRIALRRRQLPLQLANQRLLLGRRHRVEQPHLLLNGDRHLRDGGGDEASGKQTREAGSPSADNGPETAIHRVSASKIENASNEASAIAAYFVPTSK